MKNSIVIFILLISTHIFSADRSSEVKRNLNGSKIRYSLKEVVAHYAPNRGYWAHNKYEDFSDEKAKNIYKSLERLYMMQQSFKPEVPPAPEVPDTY